jgi:general secretion pathway protein A
MTGGQMYLESFGLKEHPFRLSPDPRFLFLSKQHARARAYMESTVWFSDGFVVVTGEIGAGKTTLLELFLSELDDTVSVARIHQTQVSAVQFLQSVLSQFGIRPFNMRKAELLDALSTHLRSLLAAGRRVVIVVDEAQNLDTTVLEEIRMLSDIGPGAGRVVSIILAGQPELNATLDSPALEQLAQRTRLRFHLRALSELETGQYIMHRLEIAGAERHIFDPEVFPLVFRYTGGVPRLINTLCDTAMLVSFGEEKDTVGPEEIREAIRELQWTDYASRTNRLRTGLAFGGETVARLMISSSGEEPREFPLTEGRFVLGRTADNDIQLDSRFVSRHHAQLTIGSRTAVIEDLNSTNGIYFGGRRVKRRSLKDGEAFVIGEHELLYRVGQGAKAWATDGPTARDAEEEEADLEAIQDEFDEDRAGREGG